MNDRSRIVTPGNNGDRRVVSMEKVLHKMGDLAIETNGSPAQVLAAGGNQWHPSTAAVFVGVVLELDERDSRIAELERKLEQVQAKHREALDDLEARMKRTEARLVEAGEAT